MRILHFACVSPSSIGGIGAVAAREVSGLRARGADARLVAPEPETDGTAAMVRERSFVELIKPRLRFGNGAWLPDVASLARSADVIHLHYPFYGTAEPLLLQSAGLPPIVLTFHMDASASGLKGLLFRAHRRLFQPALLDRAARIMVSSFDYARHSSLASYFLRHPERVTELPFGVDTDAFSPGPTSRSRFGIPSDAPVLLFVGGLDRAHAFKGVPELLRAAAVLPSTTRVIVIGEGDLRARYERLADDAGLRGRAHFFGRVDRLTLRDAYRSADLFVFPSTNRAEAFGLAALEAEACGLPVVASDLPGVRTVVRHGETGLLVPPRSADALVSALSTLLGDAARRRSMGDAARRHAETFSWDRHVDRLLEMYASVRLPAA